MIEALLEIGREGDIQAALVTLAAYPKGDPRKKLDKSMALISSPVRENLQSLLP